MRCIRIAGLFLACAFVMGIVLAASASASLPEWGGCEPTPRGIYTDSACVRKAEHRKTEGKYEWYTGKEFGRVDREAKHEPPFELRKYGFAGEFGPATFKATSGKTMTCTGGGGTLLLQNPEAETIGGQGYEGPNGEELFRPTYEIHGTTKGVKEVFLRFTGCESEGQPCESNLAYEEGEVSNEGAWVFETGEDPVGKLGWVNKEKGEVGLSLTTTAKTKRTERQALLKANCQGPVGTINIGGEKEGKNTIIGLIGPLNTMSTEFTQVYSEGAPGEQVPSMFEGHHEETLRMFLSNEGVWERLALSTKFTMHKEYSSIPPIEIKAEP